MNEKKEGMDLAVILNKQAVQFRKIAPKYVNIERLMALAIEAKIRNPKLAECSSESVIDFCKKCAEAGTDRVGAGGMWAVPFKNGKTGKYDMIPIPDWRLIVEKAKKAKAIKHATAVAVYDKDFFEYEYGFEPKLIHKPAKGERGNLSAAYCVYTLPDDTKEFVVMSWKEIEEIRNRTNAWKSHLTHQTSNPWVTDPAEQSKKTVIKRALKIFEGASPELTKLLDVDNQTNGFPELEDPEPIREPKAIDTTALEKEIKPEPKQEKEPLIVNPKEKKAPVKDKLSPELKPQDKDVNTLPFSPITNQQIAALKKICKKSALEGPALTKFIQDFFSPAYSGKIEDLTSVEAGEVIKELQTI